MSKNITKKQANFSKNLFNYEENTQEFDRKWIIKPH